MKGGEEREGRGKERKKQGEKKMGRGGVEKEGRERGERR